MSEIHTVSPAPGSPPQLPTQGAPPAALNEIARHGLAGEVLRRIEPHTEADPAALLLTLLVIFGNVVGRRPRFVVSGTEHYPSLFVCHVGATSSGRKGTSLSAISQLFRTIDPFWSESCIHSGLSSGEGLIQSVRDEQTVTRGEAIVVEPGVDDKRCLVIQEEFGGALKVMQRQGNTLSHILRNCWDGSNLQTMTRRPMRATGAHVSLIGHCTKIELVKNLTTVESASGLGNRILWVWVRRSKFLPDGGDVTQELLQPLIDELRAAVEFAGQVGTVVRTPEADELWRSVYPQLCAERVGLYGALTARAAPQVLRVAMIYALLDRLDFILPVHLEAALELIRYCDDSVRFIFSDRIGDPMADKILDAIRSAGVQGLTRSEISELFKRNRSTGQIERALKVLLDNGLAMFQAEPGAGRPAQRWIATDPSIRSQSSA